MADKQSFYESINADSTFDEDFFKKAYGYSVCDSSFLNRMSDKLVQINRKDVIVRYNQWFVEYRAENSALLKRIAHWYVAKIDSDYVTLMKNNKQEVVNDNWKQKKEELLRRKKSLLQMKLQQLIEN